MKRLGNTSLGVILSISLILVACTKTGDKPNPNPTPTPTPAKIESFTATPTTVEYNGSSSVSWNVSNASSVLLNNVVVASSGTLALNSLKKDTVFTLVSGSASSALTIKVGPNPLLDSAAILTAPNGWIQSKDEGQTIADIDPWVEYNLNADEKAIVTKFVGSITGTFTMTSPTGYPVPVKEGTYTIGNGKLVWRGITGTFTFLNSSTWQVTFYGTNPNGTTNKTRFTYVKNG